MSNLQAHTLRHQQQELVQNRNHRVVLIRPATEAEDSSQQGGQLAKTVSADRHWNPMRVRSMVLLLNQVRILLSHYISESRNWKHSYNNRQ